MGRKGDGDGDRGGRGGDDLPTLSSFPSPSSSSSSDFEFTVSLSPSSRQAAAQLCPADELFYKGQLLPLHLSPRLSMVRTLLLSSVSTSSSSDTATTASRDSNGSSSSSSSSFSADLGGFLPDCDSSRPSSVTEDDARRVSPAAKRIKYLSSLTTRFSSVFLHRGSKKDPSNDLTINQIPLPPPPPLPSKRSTKEVIKKYVKKVKPLYEKISFLQQKQSQQQPHNQSNQKKNFSFSIKRERVAGSGKKTEDREEAMAGRMGIYTHSHSFSGNLRYPRRKRCAGSCPSSMRSSPSHSGLLCIAGIGGGFPDPPFPSSSSVNSSMEELQNAIEGAIAHCKSSMVQASQNKASAAVSVDDGDEICGS
ncbi:probable membrane-associated kinase regulator 1 [Elaeis guineensis]|uniref:Probable membrane-associated kinase regulator 1 n=1 Tax=Elaeis guineensis var. tenera TaxID=51953 RepID=A0A6I9S6V0_ELAGV|nr:probable membrane-associated kinase regulator 1 [Elaeis guineensis]